MGYVGHFFTDVSLQILNCPWAVHIKARLNKPRKKYKGQGDQKNYPYYSDNCNN